MLVTHWIAETAFTSWSDRASLAPETGWKRDLSRQQKGEYGGRENRTRVEPPHGSFVRLPKHRDKTHGRTHVDPGRAPRRHPHLRETP
jgi:hypothetical protein